MDAIYVQRQRLELQYQLEQARASLLEECRRSELILALVDNALAVIGDADSHYLTRLQAARQELLKAKSL
jgi:hypothetical protein